MIDGIDQQGRTRGDMQKRDWRTFMSDWTSVSENFRPISRLASKTELAGFMAVCLEADGKEDRSDEVLKVASSAVAIDGLT